MTDTLRAHILKFKGTDFTGKRLSKNFVTGVHGMPGILLLLVLFLASCARSVDPKSGGSGENEEVVVVVEDGVEEQVATFAEPERPESPTAQQTVHSAAKESKDSRSMQESTEAVAKTYGCFSENDAPADSQELMSPTDTGVAATADISQPDTVQQHVDTVPEIVADTVVVIAEAQDSVPAVVASQDSASYYSGATLGVAYLSEEMPAEGPSARVDSVAQEAKKKPFMALRTNLLYDAALVPNIGVEVGLGKGFTLAADWFGTWLFSDKNHWYWQGYGGYLTARYYFDKDNHQYSLTPGQMLSSGHHVGIYGTALTYDVEFGGIGYQAAQFGFGGGVEYGYSLRVAESLCLDFNLGLGYQGGEYKKYMPTDDGSGHYVWMSTHRRHWWGPTKAEVSLKWLIGPGKKKGGER